MFFMNFILLFILSFMMTGDPQPGKKQQGPELKIIHELFRLRNEHKADSAEQYFADTVKVYMKYLRNIPKSIITRSDKNFWKAHPKNKFEMTAPVEIKTIGGIVTAIVYGNEYPDGASFQQERIEIKFDKNKKINYYRGFRRTPGK